MEIMKPPGLPLVLLLTFPLRSNASWFEYPNDID